MCLPPKIRTFHHATISLKIMAALRLVIGAIKRQFPKVPVMTTDELQQLMRTTTQAQRKLVLLVSTNQNYNLAEKRVNLH